MTDKTLQERLRLLAYAYDLPNCTEAANALDAQAERIKALEGALRGVVSDWDARGNGLEVFKDDPECPYWSPSAAMVGSEHINRARALLGEK
jgi:hypothetical protein